MTQYFLEINTVEGAFACLTEAQSSRIVALHALNAVSSRSHMLVMVDIMQAYAWSLLLDAGL